MKLLLVHGRSQGGKDPEILRDVWLQALDKGLHKAGLKGLPSQVEVAFPFYGNRLDELAAEFELPSDPTVVPKGSPAFDEFAEFRAKVAEEMRIRSNISDAEIQVEVGHLPAEKGMQNWAWVQAIIRLIDRKVVAVSEGTIEVFLRDVFLYCRRKEVRNVINNIILKEMTDNPTVIVGHSLGSVVAYNVLRSQSAKVPLFVTIGSPLGIRAIRSSLTPLENPAGDMGWYNFYDPADVVSLYPLDAESFDVDPSITNNKLVKNWTDNRHGIIGYLDNPEIAARIYSGLN